MRKIIFTLMAMTAVLASCSKPAANLPATNEDAWKYDSSLPVPIRFASSGISTKLSTKAALEAFDNTQIGVVGADKYSWSASDPATTILNNAKAIVSGPDSEQNGPDSEQNAFATGTVSFETPRYYPVVSDHNYSFYAYYPYSDAAALVSDDVASVDAWKVSYDVSAGDVDIIWAHSEAKTDGTVTVDGFNAAYVRAASAEGVNTDDYLPALNFKHLLTAVSFNAKLAENAENTPLKVTKVVIKDAVSNVELVIVDNKTSDSQSGTLIPGDGVADITIAGADAVAPNAEGAPVGGTCLLFPAKEYTAVVYLNGGEYEESITLNPSAGESTFAANTRYVFNILVPMPEQLMDMKATLEKRTDVETDLPLVK